MVALAGNDGPDATLSQTAPRRWAAVALVAGRAARPQAGPAPPGAGDRTPVQDVRQSDLLVALAAGQNGRDRPTMAFSAQVDLGREPALGSAQRFVGRLTPRRRRSGERRRRAGGPERSWHRQSADPSRSRPARQPQPEGRRGGGPKHPPDTSDRSGSTPFRPGHSALADRARGRRCGGSTACRSPRGGDHDWVGPCGAFQEAAAAQVAAIVRPSHLNVSSRPHGPDDPNPPPFADTP